VESNVQNVDPTERKALWSMRAVIASVAMATVSFVFFFGVLRFQFPVHADENCYYAYLPAYVVEHDPTFHSWLPHMSADTLGEITHNSRTGNYLDECGIGEAIVLAPAFLISHVFAVVTGGPSDGYSAVEQVGTNVTALLALAAGLLLLRRILLRRFSDRITGVTILLLTAGTNLLNYASADGLFTHIYTFALCAALVELSYLWWANPKKRYAFSIAAVMALAVLIRNLSIVLVLIPLLYGVASLASLRSRCSALWNRRGQAAIMATTFVVLLIPQLIVWHIATNSWVVYSYGHEHFDFAHPQLLGTLFSFQPHGLFPWSPVLIFAAAGLVIGRAAIRDTLPMTVMTFAVFTFLVASWDSWWFGGGYGQRGFIDIYPLLSFGLAGFVQFLAARRRSIKVGGGLILGAICAAVLIQMNHYWHLGADPSDPLTWGGATPAQYFDGILHPTK
jgi:hypothetical protein